jgi:hypothetical protein
VDCIGLPRKKAIDRFAGILDAGEWPDKEPMVNSDDDTVAAFGIQDSAGSKLIAG